MTPDQAQKAFTDPGFYSSLAALPNISAPDVRSFAASGDRVELVLGYRFAGTLSGPARLMLDPAKLTWSQKTTTLLSERRTEVTMVPDHYQDLLSFRGEYTLSPAAEGHCYQHLEADLGVNIPLLGPLAERAIASGVKENLAATARLVERYVNDPEGHGGHAPA